MVVEVEALVEVTVVVTKVVEVAIEAVATIARRATVTILPNPRQGLKITYTMWDRLNKQVTMLPTRIS